MAAIDNFEQDFIGAVKGIVRFCTIIEGVVKSVDTSQYLCSVQIGGDQGATYYDIPLKVQTGVRASIVEIPVVGSECIMGFRDGNDGRPQLLWAETIKDWLINCDGTVIFNEGNLGGMVKVNDMVSRLNFVEKDINTLKTAFSAWVVSTGDGGAALKAAAAVWYSQQLTPTKKADIENPKIKQ